MIYLPFNQEAGGPRSFTSWEQAAAFVMSEYGKWQTVSNSWISESAEEVKILNSLVERWSTLSGLIGNIARAISGDDDNKLRAAAHQIAHLGLISRDSPLGSAIVDIGNEQGWGAAAGALASIPFGQNVDGSQPISMKYANGALALQFRLAGLSLNDTATLAERIRQNQHDTESSLTKFRVEAESLLRNFEGIIEQLKNAAEMRSNLLNREASSASEQIGVAVVDVQSKWDSLYQAYSEQIKLNAPATLWSQRAIDYAYSSAAKLKLVYKVGSSGFVISIIWAYVALILPDYAFPDAALKNVLYPLIFSAGATLLYLTMYLWLMKLLIRTYMTDHHLAIDAKARASMTETYIALIADQSATPEDRHVLFNAIFRPVSDGLVRDEGPPIITPAGLIASRLHS